MSKADATHFDTYRQQTRIKHRILSGYLPAYFTALFGRSTDLLFVDGFAGRGTYSGDGKEHPGSPLLALKLIAEDPKRSAHIRTIFIEDHDGHYRDLESAVSQYCREHPELKQPILRQGKFAATINDALDELSRAGVRIGPTFLFVDPCGVDGTSLRTIAQIVSRPASELFLFFNSSGIERVIGAARKTGTSATLEDLYGSPSRVTALLSAVQGLSGSDMEVTALQHYWLALRQETNCRYVLPFRIEAEERQDTSHYLIHACQDCLGFKIMKHVMTEVVPVNHPQSGLLEFKQASSAGGAFQFRFDLAALRKETLSTIGTTVWNSKTFIDQRICRPTDFYSEKTYKTLIIDLEREGLIEVFKDQQCAIPYPQEKRLRKNAMTGVREPTLGETCWIRATT